MSTNNKEKTLGQINLDACCRAMGDNPGGLAQDWYEAAAKAVESAVLARQPQPVAGAELSEEVLSDAFNNSKSHFAHQNFDNLMDDYKDRIRRLGQAIFERVAQPAALPAMGLSNEVESAIREAANAVFCDGRPVNVSEVVDYTIGKVRLRLAEAAPTVHRTAEKPPTAADADFDGHVRAAAHGAREGWTYIRWDAVCKEPRVWPLWFSIPTIPPAPVEPEPTPEERAQSAKMEAVQQLRLKHGVISEALPEMWDAAKEFFSKEGK